MQRVIFRPPLWSILLVLLLAPAMIGLGLWQIDRAHQKQAQMDDFVERGKDAPIRLPTELQAPASLRFRPVTVRGRFDSTHQFLLDNRVHQGRAGYHVLTPLHVEGTDVAVLVDRGWIETGVTRARLPDVALAETPREVTGILDVPPERVFLLKADDATQSGWPKVLQRIDIDVHEQQLGFRLLPVVILMDPKLPDGYVRVWDNPMPFGPERNLGYAFQWFAMAFALVVIFVAVNLKRANDDE